MIYRGMCKVNFWKRKGLSCKNDTTLCWDLEYTRDVYRVSKAFFLDRKGVIALVVDTIGNALVLVQMRSKVVSLGIRRESVSSGRKWCIMSYFRVGVER